MNVRSLRKNEMPDGIADLYRTDLQMDGCSAVAEERDDLAASPTQSTSKPHSTPPTKTPKSTESLSTTPFSDRCNPSADRVRMIIYGIRCRGGVMWRGCVIRIGRICIGM